VEFVADHQTIIYCAENVGGAMVKLTLRARNDNCKECGELLNSQFDLHNFCHLCAISLTMDPKAKNHEAASTEYWLDEIYQNNQHGYALNVPNPKPAE